MLTRSALFLRQETTLVLTCGGGVTGSGGIGLCGSSCDTPRCPYLCGLVYLGMAAGCSPPSPL